MNITELFALFAEVQTSDDVTMRLVQHIVALPPYIECADTIDISVGILNMQMKIAKNPLYEEIIWENILSRIDPACLPDKAIEYLYEHKIATVTLGHMELPDKWLKAYGKCIEEALITLAKRMYRMREYSCQQFAEFIAGKRNHDALLDTLLMCEPDQKLKKSCLLWVCSKSLSNALQKEAELIMLSERVRTTSNSDEIVTAYDGCNEPLILLGIAENVFTPTQILKKLVSIGGIKNASAIRNAASVTISIKTKLDSL